MSPVTHKQAKQQNLEPVYPEGHELGERIFWDPNEGEYYDASTDLYLWGFDPVTQTCRSGR